MRHYVSSPRKKSGYERRETTVRGTVCGWSNAPCLANSSAVSLPERNEKLGFHCSLIEEEKKDIFCHMCQCEKKENGSEKSEARTKREFEGRRRKENIGNAAETSGELTK